MNRPPKVRNPNAESGFLPLLGVESVGRDLLDHESVVGQIMIEGADDIIAVGVGPVVVGVLKQNVPLGIGVAGDVEPVSPPSLAIAWRGQQAIDQAIERIRRGVGLEFVDFFRRWRQTQEVKGGPPYQSARIGLRRR